MARTIHAPQSAGAILSSVERVVIVGPGGAGKSTLARKLGASTGLPVIHLDREYWHANWQPTPDDEWIPRVRELVGGERWIIEGNYGGTMDIRFAAADTIVFLDFPRHVFLPRALKRSLSQLGRTRADMAPGCNERVDLAFTKWLWDYPREARQRTLAALGRVESGKPVVVLRSQREVDQWLAGVTATAPARPR
jgi:adenylate kinase family enzyme